MPAEEGETAGGVVGLEEVVLLGGVGGGGGFVVLDAEDVLGVVDVPRFLGEEVEGHGGRGVVEWCEWTGW